MPSTKKQALLRLDPDVHTAGKQAGAMRGLDFNNYVERLIVEDITGARAAGMAAAQRFLDHDGGFLDHLEGDLDQEHAAVRTPRDGT